MRTARKHYCRSIELNKDRNTRAYAGLVSCTRTIATHRNNQRGGDAEDNALNERVHKFAIDYLTQFYAAKATPELADIGALVYVAHCRDSQADHRVCSRFLFLTFSTSGVQVDLMIRFSDEHGLGSDHV
jgi:hypothetical protein